jgi:hypothetical protein
LILLDVVPGHGRENLMHELELGGSAMCEPTPEGIVGAVDVFLAQTEPIAATSLDSANSWEVEFISALRQAGIEIE